MTRSSTFNFDKRTHGLKSTYADGCKCAACRAAVRAWNLKHQYDACPSCGEPKFKRSTVCGDCSRTTRATTHAAGPIRAVDLTRQANPSWRPAHYPPPCEACNGFGYRQVSVGFRVPTWPACPSCKDHPGNACSWDEWTRTKPDPEPAVGKPRVDNGDALLAQLRAWQAQHGTAPTNRDWKHNRPAGALNVNAIRAIYGSWNAALEAAGLDVHRRGSA